MKSISILLALFVLSFSSYAQPAFEWAKGIGGAATDVGIDIATDSDGNVYMCGRFQGTIDADPGTGTSSITSAGDFDMCVIKLDADGDFVWVRTVGGTGFDQFTDVKCDNDGNVILAASYAGTLDADPNAGTTTLTSAGSDDIFVLKLDADGATQWIYGFGGTQGDYNGGLGIDSFNDIYLAGGFSGTTNFDPDGNDMELTSNGENDIYVLRITEAGTFGWVERIGSASFDYAEDLCVDNDNHLVIAGRFRETVDFDPNGGTQNSTSAGLNDGFVVKLDNDGDYTWHNTTGGAGFDETWSVTTDTDNNVLTFGWFTGTIDLDPGAATQSATSIGTDDVFVQKFNAAGGLVWARSFGGTELENSYDIVTDSQDNVYMIGDFFNTVDFDPGIGVSNLTSAGNNDIYYLKLDADGLFDWAVKIGVSFSQAGYAIAVDDEDNILSTGTFSSNVDFNPGTGLAVLTSQDFNIYVLKLANQCVLPDLVSATPSAGGICGGETITLTIDGSLNDATSWNLYAGSCDGTAITSTATSSLSFEVAAGTSYFLQGQGGCITSETMVCEPITISVNPSYELFESLSMCEGSSHTFPDGTVQTITDDVSYTSTLQTAAGCDSIIQTNINVPTLPNELEIDGLIIELVDYSSKSGVELQWVDCNNNFEPIENATGPVFEIPGQGFYAVVVSDNGCSAMTDCVGISSVEDVKGLSLTEAYPNPFVDEIVLRNVNAPVMNVVLFTLDGKELMRFEHRSSQAPIKMDGQLPAGIYMLRIETASGNQYLRMIKE